MDRTTRFEISTGLSIGLSLGIIFISLNEIAYMNGGSFLQRYIQIAMSLMASLVSFRIMKLKISLYESEEK